jgi:MFS family permease
LVKHLELHGIVLTSAMPIILLALLLFVVLAFGGVVLLSLALRYRAGTARRQGRRWVATMNVWMTSLSGLLFLSIAFLMSFWLGRTFQFALAGMAIGAVLGLLGLVLTRWEFEREKLFYTPSRWLALLITLAIAARFIYGWWHATHPGNSVLAEQHWWMTASFTQFSFAVAAGLIGYYLTYAVGVRLRLSRHEQRCRG